MVSRGLAKAGSRTGIPRIRALAAELASYDGATHL
jgi:hypothetical protein